MDRIYIGGLNPPHLTAEEVISRICTIPEIEIAASLPQSKYSRNETFCFVNVQLLQKEDQEKTAFELVANQYHNVKWKGCKLSVERAKPHYLERLEEERRTKLEREKESKEKKEAYDANKEKVQYVHIPKNIPRHLRIRQRFGVQAYHVDTKPTLVEGKWSDFSKALDQLQKRRGKYREKSLEYEKMQKQKQRKLQIMAVADQMAVKPFLNRAVHLRFDDSYISKETKVNEVSAKLLDHDPDQTSVVSSDDSNEYKTENDDSENNDDRSIDSSKVQDYVWSSDDDDDSIGGRSTELTKHSCVSKISEYDDGISVKKDGIGKLPEMYKWSHNKENDGKDDSGSDESSIDKNQRAVTKLAQNHASNDEFASAINLSDEEYEIGEPGDNASNNDDGVSDSEISDNGIDIKKESSINLQDDVQANLDVLSKLFPSMTAVAANPIYSRDVDSSSANNTHQKETEYMRPGWEAAQPSLSSKLGTMQRYDPTKESAKKYVVESEEKNSDGMEAFKDTNAASEKDRTDSENAIINDEVTQQVIVGSKSIYEQNKLENVFRVARESEGDTSFQLGSKVQEKIEDKPREEDTGAFSFSFNLESKSMVNNAPVHAQRTLGDENTNRNEAFSFSFNLESNNNVASDGKESTNAASGGKESTNTASVGRESTNLEGLPEVMKTEEKSEAVNKSYQQQKSNQRRGLLFPREDLDRYAESFYEMNEGSRIINDLTGFRRDEELKEKWTRERGTLTLDWKRKRKYAQSRMQKKMKFR